MIAGFPVIPLNKGDPEYPIQRKEFHWLIPCLFRCGLAFVGAFSLPIYLEVLSWRLLNPANTKPARPDTFTLGGGNLAYQERAISIL